LENFRQVIQKQRYQNFLNKKLSKLISKPSPRRRGKTNATPQQARLSWLDFLSGTCQQKQHL